MNVMKKLIVFFIILLNFCSCNKKIISNVTDINNLNITRFSMTDKKTGKRYSGIFNEKKEVLFFDEGIIIHLKEDLVIFIKMQDQILQ